MFSHFNAVDVFFQIIVLLFAICVHESAHAWMANRLGDPTAKMLGRVSLNPIVHIDPFGTILMPLILIVLGFPPFGWAKPTPVDNRNFKNPVRDDILTAVAGPVSNFLTAFVAIVALAIIWHGSSTVLGNHTHGADIAEPLSQAVLRRHVDQRDPGGVQPDPVAAAGWQPRHPPFPVLQRAASLRPHRLCRTDHCDLHSAA